MSSLAAVIIFYLRPYYDVRTLSLVTLGRITDALQLHTEAPEQLHAANSIADEIRETASSG